MHDKAKRSTIYFDPLLYRALQSKSEHRQCSISALVNEAVRIALAEDEEDLAAFETRADEPTITLQEIQSGCPKIRTTLLSNPTCPLSQNLTDLGSDESASQVAST
jgi:hypothetical protein